MYCLAWDPIILLRWLYKQQLVCQRALSNKVRLWDYKAPTFGRATFGWTSCIIVCRAWVLDHVRPPPSLIPALIYLWVIDLMSSSVWWEAATNIGSVNRNHSQNLGLVWLLSIHCCLKKLSKCCYLLRQHIATSFYDNILLLNSIFNIWWPNTNLNLWEVNCVYFCQKYHHEVTTCTKQVKYFLLMKCHYSVIFIEYFW